MRMKMNFQRDGLKLIWIHYQLKFIMAIQQKQQKKKLGPNIYELLTFKIT